MNGTGDTGENPIVFKDGHLSYIGHECETLPSEVMTYCERVHSLDLSFNCIRTLERLNGFSKLAELVLDNNCLSDDIQFPDMNELHTLMLNKNLITDLDHLLNQISHHLPKLKYLSLLGNIACPNQLSSMEKDDDDYRRYRLYVLYKLPQLKFLDSTPVKESERQEAKRQGEFLKVVKPVLNPDTTVNGKKSKGKKEDSSQYSPLPDNLREEPDHRATFGKCRYMYYGKHSEGNRFIRNNDL